MLNNPKVAVYTLGCKVNQNESDTIISHFKNAGYQEVPFEDKADVYLVNTCTVTHLADRKSRQMIRRAIRKNNDALIVVTGCYAQTAPEAVLNIPGVDLVIGTRDRFRLVELVEEAKRSEKPVNAVKNIMEVKTFEEIPGEEILPHRARAYLKIQEGCNRFCSYCIIPFARGPVRSRPISQVLKKAKQLIDSGYQEIILTGIHTGAYGTEIPQGYDLTFLIEKLINISGLKRLRVSSIEPNEVCERMIELMSVSPILCRHLHIPLQSGNDAVLQRMNRVYNVREYARLIKMIREKIPEIAITTDVIVGFPGETEEEFTHTYTFIEKMNFSRLHVFKYSPRKGTPAASFPNQVSSDIKEERSTKLISLGRRLSREYAEKNINKVLSVLVEQRMVISGREYWEGHTDNYLRVVFVSGHNLQGRLVQVHLDAYKNGFIFGHLV